MIAWPLTGENPCQMIPDDAFLICLGNAWNSALIVAASRSRPGSEWTVIIKSRILLSFLLWVLLFIVVIWVISLSLYGRFGQILGWSGFPYGLAARWPEYTKR